MRFMIIVKATKDSEAGFAATGRVVMQRTLEQ